MKPNPFKPIDPETQAGRDDAAHLSWFGLVVAAAAVAFVILPVMAWHWLFNRSKAPKAQDQEPEQIVHVRFN